MKKLFFVLSGALMLGSTAVLVEDPSVVIVRASDLSGRGRIIVLRGAATPEETVECPSASALTLGYQKVILKLYNEGYVLQQTLSSSNDQFTAHTLIFVKTPKP